MPVLSSSELLHLPGSLLRAQPKAPSLGRGIGWHAVLCEDLLELGQGGVRAHPRRVKVGPTYSETCLCQVLEEFVQPEGAKAYRNQCFSLTL